MSIATTGVSSQQVFTPGSPPATFTIPNTITYQQASEIYATLSQAGLSDIQLVQGNDFSVSAGPSVGGTVTRIGSWAAYASYGTITIYRKTSPTNNLSLPNGGAIDGPTMAQAIDELDQLIQEMNPASGIPALGHLLQAPLTDPPGLNYTVPAVAGRANQALLFGADGGVVAGQLSGAPINAAWQAALAQSVAAILAATIAKEPYTPTAGYTPATGDVVEMNYDGTIRKSKRFNTNTSLSAGAVDSIQMAGIDATHVLIVFSLDTKAISAVVATVSLADGSITGYGTPVAVATPANAPCISLTALTSSLFLLSYNGPTNGISATMTVVTLSVSGTTVTVNSGTAVTVASVFHHGVWGIDATHAAISYETGTQTVSIAIVSISGTTPTINATATITSTVVFSTGASFRSQPMQIVVDPDGYSGMTQWLTGIAPGSGRIGQFTITPPTTIASATELGVLSGGTLGQSGGEIGPSGRGFYAVIQGATPGLLQLCERNLGASYTMVFSAIPAFSMGVDSGLTPIRGIDRTAGVFAICFAGTFFSGGSSPYTGFIFIFKRSGISDVFSFGDPASVNLGGGSSTSLTHGMCVLPSSGIVVVGFSNNTAGNAVVATLRRRNRVLGLAVDNAGTVQRSGIFVTSGLTPGAKYYADDNGALTTTPGEVEIGNAIDATHLVLAVRQGV